MIPTCAVKCVLHDQSGAPEVGAVVRAKLNRYEVYNGYIVPEVVTATTDANGECILDLWPNALGATESLYTITLVGEQGRKLQTTASVPNVATANLHEIAELPAYEGKSEGQLSLEAAIAVSAPTLAAAIEASGFATAANTSATEAAASAAAALVSETNAAASATSADTSRIAAEAAQTAVVDVSAAATQVSLDAAAAATSEANAATSATQASTSATTASTAETNASGSAQLAADWAEKADGLDVVGVGTRSSKHHSGQAAVSATNAQISADAAAVSESNANTSATSAEVSETAAGISEANSASSAANSSGSAAAAAASALAAATSETNAAGSASSASASEIAAGLSESAAATSATNANTYMSAAQSAQLAAEAAETATASLFDQFGDQYLGSKTADPTLDNDGDPLQSGAFYWNSVSTSLRFYEGSIWVDPELLSTTAATNAQNSATAAATSASTATTQAGIAITAVSDASTSEANAAASATAASTSANSASTNAGTATTQAGIATTQAGLADTARVAAQAAQTAAETAETGAIAARDDFYSRYLGVYANDTAANASGYAISEGLFYWNSTDNGLRIYTGTAWSAAVLEAGDTLVPANNLSDLTNVVAARTNLGLGSAAVVAASTFATSAQGTKADTAHGWGDHSLAGYLTSVSWTAVTGKPATFTPSVHTHTLADVTDSGTAAGLNVPAAGDAAVGEVVLGSDSRLSDARSPTAHSHAISDVTGLQTALNGKVDDSQVLTNVPAGAVFTDTTYSVGNGGLTEINFTTAKDSLLGSALQSADLNGYALESYVDTAISDLVATAPATLNTLNELAAALGDDPNFATTVSTQIGGKANAVHTHAIADVTGLQTALNGKVDDSQVLTNVPVGAVFTDTTYSVGNGGLTEINFTSALNSKLSGIATGATNTAAPAISTNGSTPALASGITAAEIRSLIGAGTSSSNNATHTGEVTGSTALTIASNVVDADNLKVTGNGTTSQYLRSDGDGSFTWATPPDTNTTYSVGNGGLTEINFTSALNTKLSGIATGATNTAAPAITTDGSTPSLTSGITGAEVRTLIGAGTSSFNGAYSSLTGRPTLGSLAALSTVNAATITDNSVGAAELNVSGNGTTSQYLRADGDGTFTWATPPNTTYSVGDGGLTEKNFTTALNNKLSGIEAGANVTDTANVTAAGALMDSEVNANLKTLTLPASTTISTFGASLVDDGNAATARATLGLGTAATTASTAYATAAQGSTADSALQPGDIGSTVQAFDADTLKADVHDTLVAGFDGTPEALGTITSGTVTPEVDGNVKSNFKSLTNNGAFTLAPPSTSSDCTIRIHVINAVSAGAITTTGFDKVFDPDSYDTTNAKEYFFYIDHTATRDVLTIREIV